MHAEEAPAAEGAAADPERTPQEPGTWLGAVYEALCLGQPGYWMTGDELARCVTSGGSLHSGCAVACCLSSASMTFTSPRTVYLVPEVLMLGSCCMCGPGHALLSHFVSG